MEQTKLTVRVPRDLLENVKRYAAENNTTDIIRNKEIGHNFKGVFL